MAFYVRVNERSINKQGEELCGDKMDVIRTEDSSILILADGLGSGVKANILATMTVKIIGTLLKNGEIIDDAVDTVMKTLPVCSVRGVAYCTFTILQVFSNGDAYLVEYENPPVLFFRNKKNIDFISEEREVNGKKIKESYFKLQHNDYFFMVSDGTLYCSPGRLLNMNWNIDAIRNYVAPMIAENHTTRDIAVKFLAMCNTLYEGHHGDDTSVMVCRIEKPVYATIMIGPPMELDKDEYYINKFMEMKGMKILCGGSTANMYTKITGLPAETIIDPRNTETPPIAKIEGLHLVTEGVITLSKVQENLERYDSCDDEFYLESKVYDGASMLTEILINKCSHIHFMIGQAENQAHKTMSGTIPLYMKLQLLNNIINTLEKIGREVTKEFY